jgi:hypothetical protein
MAVDLTGPFVNPFDFDEVLVQGHFVPPSGREVVVDGFHYRDFDRVLDGKSEKLTPKGEPEWRVRFTPVEAGAHRYWVTAKTKAGEAKTEAKPFSSAAAPFKGFIRVGGVSKLHFEYADGSPYFAVGENVCWSGSRGTYDFYDWFGKLAEAGGNYARLWIGPFDSFTLENKAGGLGRYDLAAAWRIDHVVRLAEQKGIALMYCTESFNSLRSRPEYNLWHLNPYNAANGGMLQRTEDFFTNAEAKRKFKARLRYSVARTGYSPALFSWEFWNEVDIIDKYVSADVRAWHEEMARFLRGIDPYRHLITTSFAGSEGDAAVDGLPEMDYVQTHNYGSKDVAEMASGYGLRKAAKFNKPHYLGEFGVDVYGKDNKGDPAGVHLHNGLWAPIVSLSSGTGMLWWWDNYVHPSNLYYHFKPVAAFVKDVDFNRRTWAAIEKPAVTFASPPAKPEVDDLFVETKSASWDPAPFNQPTTFTVSPDGRVDPADRLARVLHGTVNHTTLHNPATFQVDFRQAGSFVVHVSGVSGYGGAKLKVWLDDALKVDRDLADTNPQGKNETLTKYNGPVSVEVPPGKHTVKVVNDGKDWMYVDYELKKYRVLSTPNLRVLGQVGSGTLALLWIQNRDSTWFKRSQGREPREVPPSKIAFSGLRDGEYAVEWWDTGTGVATETKPASCTNGTITIVTPAVRTDVACKVRIK